MATASTLVASHFHVHLNVYVDSKDIGLADSALPRGNLQYEQITLISFAKIRKSWSQAFRRLKVPDCGLYNFEVSQF
jgi:hypothetical protein